MDARARVPRSCSRGRRAEKRALRTVVCDPRRSVTCAAVTLRARFTLCACRASPRSRRPWHPCPRAVDARRRAPRATGARFLTAHASHAAVRASGLGGRRDAERTAAVRSRKARAAIGTPARLPRWGPRIIAATSGPVIRVAQRHARRIGAPSMCRPHASVVAAGARGYEPRAVSRCAARRTARPLARTTGPHKVLKPLYPLRPNAQKRIVWWREHAAFTGGRHERR